MRSKLIILLVLFAVLGFMFSQREEKTEAPEAVAEVFSSEQEMVTGTALAVNVEKNLGTVSENPNGEGIVITVSEEGAESEVFTFEDISVDDWYVEAVNYVASAGLMRNVITSSGRPLFCPDYGVTRAQFSTILYRFCGGEPTKPLREYTDVPEYEWYYDMIHWVDANDLMDSIDMTTFGAMEHLSCEEVLVALHRVAGEPESFASLEDYPYALKVSKDGTAAMRWAWGAGLIAEEECIWYPTQAISRAQLALLLSRYDALAAAAAQ